MATVKADLTAQASAPGLEIFPAMSSWIAAFEYDAANLTLTTHLRSGALYQHKMVLPLDWESLKTSQNHSKHWANNIKGKKISVKIKGAKAPLSETKHRHYGR